MDIHRYRHSELAERTESVIDFYSYIYSFTSSGLRSVPRSVDENEFTMPALPFVRSMGPNTRNVFAHYIRPNRPKTPHFGPTDIACLPGPKIDRNFRNFVINKKNKYLFYFYKIILYFFFFSKIKFFVTNYFFFDLVESKGIMPLCRTTALLAKAM